MPIQPNVPIATATPADVYFYKADNTTPEQLIGGVVYSVFAPNGLKVLSGTATQDLANPAHWTTSITIPQTAPITTDGQYYNIIWVASGQTTKFSQQQSFSVVNPNNAGQFEATVIALLNQPFNIDLVLPYPNIKTLAVQILNGQSTVVYAMPGLSTTPSFQNGSQYIYRAMVTDPNVLAALGNGTLPPTATSPVVGGPYAYAASNNNGGVAPYNYNSGYNYGPPSLGLEPYMIYITYTDPYGNQQIELQPLYICNTLCVQTMNAVRNFVDRIRNYDNIPQLRIDEKTLVEFTVQGLMRVNATPPQQIYFTFNQMPGQFHFYVQKAACIELLQAQYLAEGMTAFNFSGMSVQLDSDRTQYIATIVDGLRTDMEQLVTAKKNYARSGGGSGSMGTINIVWGPNTNFVWKAFPGSIAAGAGFMGIPFLT
jgi:hypothetical protein